MSDGPVIPVIDATIAEAQPGTFGAALPKQLMPEGKNYAEDAEVLAQIQEVINPIIDQTRNDRRSLEEEWNSIRRMELLQHDSGKRYNGRSDAYIPVFNRNSQTLVSSLSRGLFPSDEYFDVSERSGQRLEDAKAVKAYLQWEFESVGQVRRCMKPFLKQFVNLGNSVLKHRYNKQQRYEGRLSQLKKLGMSGQMGDVLAGSFKPQTFIEGLNVSARSIFHVYVYPTHAENLAEASCVFEDIIVPRAFIEAQLKSGAWKGEAGMSAMLSSEAQNNDETMKQARNMSGAESGGAASVGVTEVWTYLKLPRSAYLPGENPDCPLPAFAILADGHPVFVSRNPFWHQTPPYLFARMNTEPGHFYGYGFGKTVRYLQYLVNDFANQTSDVGTYSLNPMALVNPGLLAGPMPAIRPGVTIPVTDSDAVTFIRPPWELVRPGQEMLALFQSMVQDLGGAPPILQGQGGGNSGKTATGSQILQRNAMLPLQDIVEDLELDVMLPLLKAAWINAQQYRSEPVFITVAGKSLRVDPSSLAIDADFRYLASSQAVNQQQRAQQAIMLIQSLMPVVPLLMQNGYTVNPAPLINRIYSDGFGFRGFDEFIHKMTPEEQMALMQQQMAAQGGKPGAGDGGGPPGPQHPGDGGGPPPDGSGGAGDRVRSAVEQAPGGSGDMAPGEGSDFMDVRAQADALAGLLGSSTGGGGPL